MIVLLISAVVTGFLGRYVAKEKGREAAEGFILGFLFSLIGVIVEAILPSKKVNLFIEKVLDGNLMELILD